MRVVNGTYNWQSNTQTPIQIVQAAYLRDLELIVQGTPTFGGAVAVDPLGPFNVLNNVQVNSNVQAGIINASGDALAWWSMMKWALEEMGNSPYTALVQEQNAADGTYELQVPLNSGFSGNPLFQVPFEIPLAQKINTMDGYVGIWDLQDPSIQMTLNFTPNSPTAASPFSIVSSTKGNAPYFHASNTVTLTSPQNIVTRVMYDPPADAQNDPDFGYVHSIYEETWNTGLAGSKTINWRALANSGYITRLLFSVFDSNASNGVADSNMTGSNAINLTIGNNAPVVVETAYEAAFRQYKELGKRLPQGVHYIDFLGRDLTMQNVLDTFTAGNINLQMNFVSALGATSSGKVVRGMLQALQQ